MSGESRCRATSELPGRRLSVNAMLLGASATSISGTSEGSAGLTPACCQILEWRFGPPPGRPEQTEAVPGSDSGY